MATYQDIKGLKVKYLSADPGTLRAGDVWYNSVSNTLKGVVSFAAWSSASPLSNPVFQNSGTGIQTASLSVNGGTGPPSGYRTATEEYNGTGWSTGGVTTYTMGYGGASGTQTAALAGGGDGNTPGACDEYDGTTWTGAGAMGINAYQGKFAGTQTATVAAGMYYDAEAYEYNGASWTATSSDMPTHVNSAGAVGTQAAAAFLCGGNVSGGASSSLTQEWNGSSWSLGPANTLSGTGGAASGQAPSSDCLMMVAGPPKNQVSRFDGSSWTTSPATMATARNDGAGAGGSSSSALYAGGTITPYTNVTEEFNVSIDTVTAGAWASGAVVPYSARQNMTLGLQGAAMNVGGYTTTTVNTSVEYDGTNWTATPALNVEARFGGVAGTTAAGLQFAGIQTATYSANVQTWNGSTWADSPYNLTTGTYGTMGCGTQTAALKVAGENPAGGNYTTGEEFDGEAWTASGALPQAKYAAAGNGVQTSAIITGGSPSGTTTFEYNGTGWVAGGALNTSRPAGQAGSGGTTTDSNIVFGGGQPTLVSATEGYDGTTWSTRPSLATARAFMTGAGTATAGLCAQGAPPTGTTNLTELFTGETSAATASTLTTS